MNDEVAKAHAATMIAWAAHWRGDPRPGASEVAFLLERASRIATGIATDTPVELEPISVPEEPVTEPKEG